MNPVSILGLLVFLALDLAPSPPTDLPDAIFNRPRISFGGRTSGRNSYRFAIAGNIIYVADGPMGLQVYDASDPDKPRLIGTYSTQSDAFAVSVGGAIACVSTLRGAVMLDVSDPANPKAADARSVQSRSEGNAGYGRLMDLEASASSEPASDAQPAIIAVVGDRAYISRVDGVVVIPMHSFKLPSLPSIASIRGADPLSTEAWRPTQGVVQLWSSGVHAPDTAVTTPIGPSALPIDEDKYLPPEQPLVSTISATPRITLAGDVESGVFRLLVSGPAGQKIRIQRSSSVGGGWQDWQALTLGDALVELTDEDAARSDQIFYRAIAP